MADVFEKVQTWDALARRLRQLTQGDQGVSVTTVEVYTIQGALIGWKKPESTPIEPKGAADAFKEALLMLCESMGHT